jgi:hypothetical protein
VVVAEETLCSTTWTAAKSREGVEKIPQDLAIVFACGQERLNGRDMYREQRKSTRNALEVSVYHELYELW